MAADNRRKVLNYWSSGVTQGSPNKPDDLSNGEIALNIKEGLETIFFKNTNGDIVSIQNEVIVGEAPSGDTTAKIVVDITEDPVELEIYTKEEVDSKVDEINEELDNLGKKDDELDGKISGIEGDITDIKEDITDIEKKLEDTGHDVFVGDETDSEVGQILVDITEEPFELEIYTKEEVDSAFSDVNGRIDKIEGDVSNVEGEVSDIKTKVTGVEGDITDIKKKLEDAGHDVFVGNETTNDVGQILVDESLNPEEIEIYTKSEVDSKFEGVNQSLSELEEKVNDDLSDSISEIEGKINTIEAKLEDAGHDVFVGGEDKSEAGELLIDENAEIAEIEIYTKKEIDSKVDNITDELNKKIVYGEESDNKPSYILVDESITPTVDVYTREEVDSIIEKLKRDNNLK